MKKFRSYEPEQGYLLPPTPKEWLPDGHVVHFLDPVVQFGLREPDTRKCPSHTLRAKNSFTFSRVN